jgi:hypothetical protein
VRTTRETKTGGVQAYGTRTRTSVREKKKKKKKKKEVNSQECVSEREKSSTFEQFTTRDRE